MPNLYPNCKLVRGYSNFIIADLQKRCYYRFPNDYLSDLMDGESNTPFLDYLNSENVLNKVIGSAFSSNMSVDYYDPGLVGNAILTVNEFTVEYLCDIVQELSELGCKNIELRIIAISIPGLEALFDVVRNASFDYKIVYIAYCKDLTKDKLMDLDDKVVPNKIIAHSLKSLTLMSNHNWDSNVFLFVEEELSEKSCGIVSSTYMTVNIPAYTESLYHNSCINRKISTDSQGNIKNCPSMKESYGNIKDTTLAEAIEKPGFRKYWDINKDKIYVCKDCEFRYICTDCRAYVEDPEDILSKPLKCGYNPYTGEWSEWSTNSLKQKAIDFYGMREMVSEMSNQNEP